MKTNLLFNPGPTNVSDRVWSAANTGNLCHREIEFSRCLEEVRASLVSVLRGRESHEAVVFACSATGCNEAVFSSLEGRVLILNNGKYSQRLKLIAEQCGLTSCQISLPDDRSLSSTEEQELMPQIMACQRDFDHLVFVHHETTTGAILPLRALGQLAHSLGKTVIVDSVSSIGAIEFRLDLDNVDFCTVSSNKALQALPGLSFVIARKTKLDALENKSRSVYFSLFDEWQKQVSGQTRFTPPVQLAFATREALRELQEETIEGRILRYSQNAARLRKGLIAIGLRIPKNQPSPIVTAIWLEESIGYQDLHDRLKKLGYTIYSDKDTLAKGYFRIATMGHLSGSQIEGFLSSLGKVCSDLGFHAMETG